MSARRDASSRVGAAIGQSPSAQSHQRSSLAKKIARFEYADENASAVGGHDGHAMGAKETALPASARPVARASGKTPLKVREPP